jgi:hypothetical protein
MDYQYQFAYAIEEGLALLPGLLSMIPSGAIQIAAYILTSLALYTMANRRGINHAWLSWVPVLNVWIIGSLSDQYRYVVKGQNRSKRKALLVLSVISAVIVAIMAVIAIDMAAEILEDAIYGMLDEDTWEDIIGPVLGLIGLALPLAGVKIAEIIIRYMALYDVYTSCDPQYNVLFLVLSILFGITEPFFLFFSRNKDMGMPPRRESTEYASIESQPETWEEPESL